MKKSVLAYHESTINRFAEKAELLAAESHTIFNLGREINRIIGIIVVHQAAELALKALCLKNERNIFEKGSFSIGFDDAINRNKKDLTYDEETVLRILNQKRNNYQHTAIFDVSDKRELNELLLDSLSIISRILNLVGYNPQEVNVVLNPSKQSKNKPASRSGIKEVYS